MIIVCACCTTRMLFEMRTMTPKATAATRIVPGPIAYNSFSTMRVVPST
jgi:hypothetical protein